MKKILFTLTALVLTFAINAQAPEAFSYQSIVKDSDGELVTEQSIGVQISILAGAADGSAIYTETHAMSTNANGLLSLMVGDGTTSDDFSAIDWSANTYYIKTEMDINGGSDYTVSGTTQMLSVPYALHAKTVDNIPSEYANIEVADSIKVGATGIAITRIIELTGTTDDTENYVLLSLPSGFTNLNSIIVGLNVYHSEFLNSAENIGPGYTGTNGTLHGRLGYFQALGGISKPSYSLKIFYPDELKSKTFKAVIMKYK